MNLKNKVTYLLLPVILIITILHIVILYLFLSPENDEQLYISIAANEIFLIILISTFSIILLSAISLIIFRAYIDKYFTKTIDYITEFIVDFGESSKIDSHKRLMDVDEIESITECLNFLRSKVNIHQKTMEKLAYFDSLTGLPNQQYSKQVLKRMLATAKRRKNHLAVLSLEINEFKTISSSMGLECGDLLLAEASKRMSNNLRDSDFIDRNDFDEANINIEDDSNLLAKFTGAKLTLLLNDIDDPGRVSTVACRILEGMAVPFKLSKHEVAVTTSIGIAIYPQDGSDVDSLLNSADYALSEAKKLGKDCYRYFTSEMNAAASERVKLEQDIRKAIENEEFRLLFHPRIKLENMNICGLEGLIQWQNPELGLVMPGQFLPMAEETVLICEINKWVFDKVCQQIKACLDKGINDIKVSVNLSKIQLYQGDTYNLLKNFMDSYGVSGKHLEIEITESGIFDDEKVAMKLLEGLRSLGISVSLDDFGSGYSTLRFLQNAPIDTIKIDRRFVTENSCKASGQQLLTSVMEIAKNLNFTTVASGIEKQDQVDLFRSMKCDYVQGYYYSNPIPSDEIVDFLIDWNSSKN